MLYQYSHRLGAYAPGLDPDAKAYIAAVETALSSPITDTQKNAINTFFKTGKSDGWYSSIKRLYLPIWADAAANAIDMITRTSGTFTATGMDHSNVGYVKGDGFTGKFTLNATNNAIGASQESHMLITLRKSSDSRSGSRQTICTGAANRTQITEFGGTTLFRVNSTTQTFLLLSGATGIFIAARTTSGQQRLTRRASGGVTTYNANVTSASIAGTDDHFGWATATNLDFSNAELGLLGCGLGIEQSDAEACSEALKNLWETASGLTLP